MPEATVLLRNRRDQPVELHLPGGVQVLAPHGQLCVEASLLNTPQVAWLLSTKALGTAPTAAAEPVVAPVTTAARARPAARPKVPKVAPVAAAPAPRKRRTAQR